MLEHKYVITFTNSRIQTSTTQLNTIDEIKTESKHRYVIIDLSYYIIIYIMTCSRHCARYT